METRMIIKVVNGCHNCPFVEHTTVDFHASPTYGDPGYDCKHSAIPGNRSRRIASDKKAQRNNYQIDIPFWCPLPKTGFTIDYYSDETNKAGKNKEEGT